MIKEEASKFAALLRSDPDVDRKSRAILNAFRKLAPALAPSPTSQRLALPPTPRKLDRRDDKK
jgi:hypothetical protein